MRIWRRSYAPSQIGAAVRGIGDEDSVDGCLGMSDRIPPARLTKTTDSSQSDC
jgi:hypothetical protein